MFTKEDSDRYEEKTKCFIKQFDDFTLLGPDNKPIHVLGEVSNLWLNEQKLFLKNTHVESSE